MGGQAGQVHPGALGAGKPGPGLLHLLEHLLTFGIVVHRVGRRTSQDQVGAEVVGDMVGNALQYPHWVLEAVPARHLDHHRG